jgi:hypothetical protein
MRMTDSPTKPRSGNLLTQTAKEMAMQAWDVLRNGKIIDTVFYDKDCTLWYVRQGLIEHDGYPVDIVVQKAV